MLCTDFFHSCMYVAGELSTRSPVDRNATYMRARAGNLPVRRARIYTQTPGGRAPVYPPILHLGCPREKGTCVRYVALPCLPELLVTVLCVPHACTAVHAASTGRARGGAEHALCSEARWVEVLRLPDAGEVGGRAKF
jgi:hypothetical protein